MPDLVHVIYSTFDEEEGAEIDQCITLERSKATEWMERLYESYPEACTIESVEPCI